MFHVKHRDWLEAAESLGIDLPKDGPQRLDAYESLLRDRAIPAGMIAASDERGLRERHLLDALRAVPLIEDAAPARIVDLGSGAGVPGIPLAIARPDVQFVLTETRRPRVAFLELVVEILDVSNVAVHQGRAELVPPPVDVCLARAFGDIRRSWKVASTLLRVGGVLIYWAGRRWRSGADLPPPGATMHVGGASGLANAGPIVIMSRQW
jgi:16S rRNA (guanine527-N7)-methyltransferase